MQKIHWITCLVNEEGLFPAMDNWPCSCAVASEEELDILHAKGLHCEVDIIRQSSH